MSSAMRSPFVFTIVAPEGVFQARFRLEAGRHYWPGEVQVERRKDQGPHDHTLTVTATGLPSEGGFRELAARAATRNANPPLDPLGWLLFLLIPFRKATCAGNLCGREARGGERRCRGRRPAPEDVRAGRRSFLGADLRPPRHSLARKVRWKAAAPAGDQAS